MNTIIVDNKLIHFFLFIQFQFVSEIANFSPFSTGKKSSLTSPGLKAQFKGCLGLNRVPSIPYLASNSQKGAMCLYFIDEEEEEDPYDTVEISPMRERKRPVTCFDL